MNNEKANGRMDESHENEEQRTRPSEGETARDRNSEQQEPSNSTTSLHHRRDPTFDLSNWHQQSSTSSYPLFGRLSSNVPSVNKHSDEGRDNALAANYNRLRTLSPRQRQRSNISTFLQGHQARLSSEQRRQMLIAYLSEALEFHEENENTEDDDEDLE